MPVSTLRAQLGKERTRWLWKYSNGGKIHGRDSSRPYRARHSEELNTRRCENAGVGAVAYSIPDRFPFLEGRAAATSWFDTPSISAADRQPHRPASARALQLLRMRGDGGISEARRLSVQSVGYREQIGHVYEVCSTTLPCGSMRT